MGMYGRPEQFSYIQVKANIVQWNYSTPRINTLLFLKCCFHIISSLAVSGANTTNACRRSNLTASY